VEGKTLSNKAFASSRGDSCSALRERVSESWERPFQDCGEKTPHSQGVQEAEFAVVGIGIALLRSQTQKAALALNRSGDYSLAGREIAFISERAECTRLALNTMSLPLFRATIHSSEVLHCYTSAYREEKSGRENPL